VFKKTRGISVYKTKKAPLPGCLFFINQSQPLACSFAQRRPFASSYFVSRKCKTAEPEVKMKTVADSERRRSEFEIIIRPVVRFVPLGRGQRLREQRQGLEGVSLTGTAVSLRCQRNGGTYKTTRIFSPYFAIL
jgi:hypothetical protein